MNSSHLLNNPSSRSSTLHNLEREYLRTIRPLIDDKGYQHAESLYQSLYEDTQQAISELENSHQSLNHQRYLALSNRQSLALSSNISSQIRWSSTQQKGLKRFTHFLNALLIQHLQPSHISALSATRIPALEQDQYAFGSNRLGRRYLLVLYKGHAWKMLVTDIKGRPATPAQLENSLYDLMRQTRESADLPFALPCYLTREVQIELLQHATHHQQRICEAITQALFSISLDDNHISDPEDALFHASFGDGGQYLCVKALSYHANLSDNHYYLHSETSLINPAEVTNHLMAVQAHYHAANFPRRNYLPDKLPRQALDWSFDPSTREMLQEQHAIYERQAERLISTPYHFFLSDEERKRFHQNHPHALFHLLLHYAQLRTYKQLRSTFAIEFHASQPIMQETVSSAAVKLAEALVNQERPQSALMRDYITEYQRRQTLSLTGNNPHQQLSHLERLLQPNPPLFFQDTHWSWFRQHPFVTINHSSEWIQNLCFAPTTSDGISISYSFQRNTISLLITHPRYKSAEVERFAREIQAALKRLLNWLTRP
ncbi:MAG: choline/carnitine O-acyltransferase [Cardiobacteriaceae bacterium]|nr:choline/carnitine O-acyltransferase [Cardiobacteriaceae bacterium]